MIVTYYDENCVGLLDRSLHDHRIQLTITRFEKRLLALIRIEIRLLRSVGSNIDIYKVVDNIEQCWEMGRASRFDSRAGKQKSRGTCKPRYSYDGTVQARIFFYDRDTYHN